MRLAVALAAAALLAGSAFAADLPPDMDAKVAEGKKWFDVAGNTDLGTGERNAARVKSWKCLWPALEASRGNPGCDVNTQATRQQTPGASMPQHVRAAARGLNAEAFHARRDHVIQAC